MYGCSTGCAPIQPNIRQSATNNQNNFLKIGLKCELRTCEVFKKGKANSDTNTKPIAATPPNLFGILRRIA